MKRYKLSEVAHYLGTVIKGVEEGEAERLSFTGTSTDTRSIGTDNLFIALIGDRFDAHEYLDIAAEAGAAAFVISNESAISRLHADNRRPYILVEDTEATLDKIANWYRQKLVGQVIGVTGSVGKTSTRQMVMAALGRSLKVSGTKANLNNHIGLATTILETDEQTGVLVVEMGIDRPGDMKRLSEMAEADIAIVTGIGVSHIEQFKTREAILEAKLEITKGLKKSGYLLLNGDNDLLLSYARNNADIIADNINSDSYTTAFISTEEEPGESMPGRVFFSRNVRTDASGSTYDCWEKLPNQEAKLWIRNVRLTVPGTHHIQNSLFALLAADILGVRAEAAKDGLQDFVLTGNRQRLIEAGGITIINDSYNASPESMKAALELMQGIAGDRRKYVALGGMNELGDLAETLHFNLGLDVAREEVTKAWLIGPHAIHVEKGIHSLTPDCPVQIFETREALADSLMEELDYNDILLIKASRSFEMEKVAEYIVSKRLLSISELTQEAADIDMNESRGK